MSVKYTLAQHSNYFPQDMEYLEAASTFLVSAATVLKMLNKASCLDNTWLRYLTEQTFTSVSGWVFKERILNCLWCSLARHFYCLKSWFLWLLYSPTLCRLQLQWMCFWLLDFLFFLHRPQRVKANDLLSNLLVSSTNSPRSCSLSIRVRKACIFWN